MEGGRRNLNDAVAKWPTPGASDAKAATKHKRGNPTLYGAVQRWPTPSATDYKGSHKPGQRRGQLTDAVQDCGQLNPRWVEWLMGFPDGWTDCEGSETP